MRFDAQNQASCRKETGISPLRTCPNTYVDFFFNTCFECFRPIFDTATAHPTGIAYSFGPSEAPSFSIGVFGCDVGQIDNVASEWILERILLRGILRLF